MKNFEISIFGKSDRDIELALEEILKKVKKGYTSGADENDEGSYSFTSTGEYEDDES